MQQAPVELAAEQRGAVVRTAFVDGVEFAALVDQQQRLAALADQAAAAVGRHLLRGDFQATHDARASTIGRSCRARCSWARISHGGCAPARDSRRSITNEGTA
ncbi:hypothetical protein D9M69_728490 [compost metagenome]